MASIKERMVQALSSKGIDTSNVDISKNPQGYWEAHVCGIILRVRQGETWACAGGGLARGSVSSKKTGLGDIEEALGTAIRRRDIAEKIGKDILRWTRMEVLPLISTVGSDIIVLAPFWGRFRNQLLWEESGEARERLCIRGLHGRIFRQGDRPGS